ncbi:MAG: HTTM domain-containing protein [Myxococcota bacterium]
MGDTLQRLRAAATRPVDGASLLMFRIAFGLIIFWEVMRYTNNGWVKAYYLDTEFRFKYWPFDFVEPWGGDGMYWQFGILGVAALAIMTGFRYRIASVVAFFSLAYIFLLDQGRYLNHFYLVVLVSFLMMFLPFDRVASLDPWKRNPPGTMPAWVLWLMRFQIGVPYFFGGVAKINGDWLRGQPLTAWLSNKGDFPVLGPLFENETIGFSMAYGGLMLDLCGVFLLMWRKTRVPTFIVIVSFHLTNSGLFKIGIFPWMMMAATLLFFPADWPKRIWRDLRNENRRAWIGVFIGAGIGLMLGNHFPSTDSSMHGMIMALVAAFIGYQLAVPGLANTPVTETTTDAAADADGEDEAEPDTSDVAKTSEDTDTSGTTLATPAPLAVIPTIALMVWCSLQILVPLRHFAYPSNVHWTEEGHLFAWHMKLRQKRGKIIFIVTNKETGESWRVDQRKMLSKKQATRMSGRPDMIVQFAHYLADGLEAEHGAPFSVHVRSKARLNDRDWAPLIDPGKDLTEVTRPWVPPVAWINPYPAAPREPRADEGKKKGKKKQAGK